MDFFCLPPAPPGIEPPAPERQPLTSDKMPACNTLGGLPFEWKTEQEMKVRFSSHGVTEPSCSRLDAAIDGSNQWWMLSKRARK